MSQPLEGEPSVPYSSVPILFIAVILTILSFMAVSGVYGWIEYCRIDPSTFSGDKFGRTPEKFYEMRKFFMICYTCIIVFPAYCISLPFLYYFTGSKAGEKVYLYILIFSVIFSWLFSSEKISDLTIQIIGITALPIDFIFAICYFSCSHMLMSLLLPKSNLRQKMRKRIQ